MSWGAKDGGALKAMPRERHILGALSTCSRGPFELDVAAVIEDFVAAL